MMDRDKPFEPDAREVRAFLEERHVELSHRIGDFVSQKIATLPPPADDAAARAQARTILGLLGDGGWLRATHPLDLRACCLIRESLAAASSLADEVFALQALGSLPIALAGGSALRDRWLPAALAGKKMAAFAMTEPEAGSDVAAITTHAEKDGDAYLITGEKTLISNAGIADFYTLFAKTDTSAGHRGISCFVVEAGATGFDFVRPLALSAPHPLGDLAFRSCRVPASQRIGDEGSGFKLGMATLDALRATVAASACGMARRALDEALSHALERRQFGSALADFQAIQLKLARMATELAAARLLVYRAAAAKDRGAERVTLESAMAKAFATEAAQRIIDDAVQIVGGRAVLADHPLDRLYRAIRPLRIYEGTTDIQHLVIARALLKAAAGES
jgi:acyl-CoA dehydrogenase